MFILEKLYVRKLIQLLKSLAKIPGAAQVWLGEMARGMAA
jgi:hypothetical protein